MGSTHVANARSMVGSFHPLLQATKTLRESRGIALFCV